MKLWGIFSFSLRWNEKRLSPSPSRIVPHVEDYVQALSGRGCSEYFGLAFKIHELLTPELDSGIIIEEEENGYDDEDETEHCLTDEDEDMVISEEQIKKTTV